MVSVKLVFGPMLAGAFLNTLLYGVLILQFVFYLQKFKRDVPSIRYFIWFLFLAETANTVFTIFLLYEPLVLQYGMPKAMLSFPLALPAIPITTVLISSPVQIFIARRIAVITKTKVLGSIICFSAFVAFGGALWLSITVIRVHSFHRKPELHWPAVVWLLASAAADILIAVSLTFSLARRKPEAAPSHAGQVINQIIRTTIQTGLATAIFATLDVVCFLALPHTTINFVWDFLLSKLYTNALLSTLNARDGEENEHERSIASNNDNVLFGSVGSEFLTMATHHSVQSKGDLPQP